MTVEIQAEIRKMKSGLATGPNGITVKFLEAFEDYGFDKISTLFNKIYDTVQIPPHISKSICIAPPKKPGPTKCQLHKTTGLMTNMLLVKVRIRNKIKSEIAEEQSRFVVVLGLSYPQWQYMG